MFRASSLVIGIFLLQDGVGIVQQLAAFYPAPLESLAASTSFAFDVYFFSDLV